MTNKPNIIILGAGGLLGTYLAKEFAPDQPQLLTHADIDITNESSVQRVLTDSHPDIIINAAAYTAVDRCETERDQAMVVNGRAPGYIAAAAKNLNAILVHYSTDYIFSGERAQGYQEDWSDQHPVNAYGESKLAGEQAILQQCDDRWQKIYLMRTAWLYGAQGTNFVDTMLRLADQQSELKVVNDQHGSPTFAADLAARTRWLLDQRSPFGVYHATNSGVCTWFDFAQTIFKLAGKAVTVTPCTSAEFPRPAARPAYSILLNTKLPPLRPWSDALADYLHQRTSNA